MHTLNAMQHMACNDASEGSEQRVQQREKREGVLRTGLVVEGEIGTEGGTTLQTIGDPIRTLHMIVPPQTPGISNGSHRTGGHRSKAKAGGNCLRPSVDWDPYCGWSQFVSDRGLEHGVDAGLPAWACCFEGVEHVWFDEQGDADFAGWRAAWAAVLLGGGRWWWGWLRGLIEQGRGRLALVWQGVWHVLEQACLVVAGWLCAAGALEEGGEGWIARRLRCQPGDTRGAGAGATAPSPRRAGDAFDGQAHDVGRRCGSRSVAGGHGRYRSTQLHFRIRNCGFVIRNCLACAGGAR